MKSNDLPVFLKDYKWRRVVKLKEGDTYEQTI